MHPHTPGPTRNCRLTLGLAILATVAVWALSRFSAHANARIIVEYGKSSELGAFTVVPSAFSDAHEAAAWRAARAADVAALITSTDPWRARLGRALAADGDDPFLIAVHGYARSGVWPVAFSRALRYIDARPPLALAQSLASGAIAALHKAVEWASVIAGNTSSYRFRAPGGIFVPGMEAAYYSQYREAWKAWTMRKGGVDCNRHLEIIGSGAVPIFKKIGDIVPTTLFNYPKHLLAFALEGKDERDEARLATLRHFFLHWMHDHQSTVAVAKYLARAADFRATAEGMPPLGLGASHRRVLYIDERLPREVDYLAVFTLLGLVEWLGPENVDVLFPVPYIYEGGPTTCEGGGPLYGGGFGYAHYFPANFSRQNHDADKMVEMLRRGEYAAVVWGSIRRSDYLTSDARVLAAYRGQPHRLWLLNGDDQYDVWASATYWWQPRWSSNDAHKEYMCFARELGTDPSYKYVWGTSALDAL